MPQVPANVSTAAAASTEDSAKPAYAAGRPDSAGIGQAGRRTGMIRGWGFNDSDSTSGPSDGTVAAEIRLGGQNGAWTVAGLSDEERAAAGRVKQ